MLGGIGALVRATAGEKVCWRLKPNRGALVVSPGDTFER